MDHLKRQMVKASLSFFLLTLSPLFSFDDEGLENALKSMESEVEEVLVTSNENQANTIKIRAKGLIHSLESEEKEQKPQKKLFYLRGRAHLILYKLGGKVHRAKAIHDFKQAVGSRADRVEYLISLGNMYYQYDDKNLPEGEKLFSQAVASGRGKQREAAFIGLFQCQYLAGKHKEAMETVLQLFKIDSQNRKYEQFYRLAQKKMNDLEIQKKK